jgi:hypothetical protein
MYMSLRWPIYSFHLRLESKSKVGEKKEEKAEKAGEDGKT